MSNENNNAALALLNELLDAPTEAVMETKRQLLLPGNYFARVSNMEARQITFPDKTTGADVTKDTVEVEFTLEIPSEIQIETGLVELKSRKTIWLDLEVTTDGRQRLKKGPNQNLDLGRFLEACGLNDGNSSLRNCLGRRVVVEIIHESTKNGDMIERIKAFRTSGEY